MTARHYYIFCLAVFAPSIYAQEAVEDVSIVVEAVAEMVTETVVETETAVEDEGIFGLGWLDRTQAYASTSANSLAGQLDRFFGVPRSDLEAPYSSLRLSWINSWDEFDSSQSDFRLRGKIYLPRVNERISLIFSSDENESLTENAGGEIGEEQSEGTKLDLGFNITEDENHRIDLRAGLSSSLKARLSLRYRYEIPAFGNFLNRLSQRIYFKDGEGFGSLSRYQLETTIGDNALLRWENDLRFEESFTGAEWETGLSYFRRQSENSAITYFYRVAGHTSPSFTSRKDVGVRFRRSVARPWLFIELEPGYSWQRQDIEQSMVGSAFVFLRLEMAIGKLQ